MNLKFLLDKKTHILQFLPNCLNYISVIKYVEFKDRKLKTTYLIDIIHNLLLKYYFKSENLFPLSSKVMKEKYGLLYNYYIQYLVEKNFIKMVKNYRVGDRCRNYELNLDLILYGVTRYKNQDPVILKKYKKNILLSLDSINGNKKNGIPTYIKQKLVNDLFSVEIEYDKSISFLDLVRENSNIYNINKYSIDCIKESNIFYHFDSYGRMHTNFTILKSHIRKNYLYIDGEKTYERDIHNSQPLFLCKLIKEEDFYIVNKDEFDFFRKLSMDGNFYEYLMEKMKISDRKEIKNIVYRILFGKNWKNKYEIIFDRCFPTIYKFIKEYKNQNENYKTLSHSLQKMESNFIFEGVVNEIMKINPGIKLITIHDSIICSIKCKEILDSVFDRRLKLEFF